MDEYRHTILIVDDTPSNIEILNEILCEEYTIQFATNALDAFSLILEEPPDLILLDVMMPVIDGYELCLMIKQEPKAKTIPVIFITAMSQEEDETKGLEMGAIDYITKPISPPIVKARIKNHLELKRYRDFLENLSAIDGLTGISNRRRFDEVLDREWKRMLRFGKPLSLILLDIDFFKAFNDIYGHIDGDECLKKVAAALTTGALRPADCVARYGGEEFACILPETAVKGAELVAQRLLENVSALRIPHTGSTITGHVTISAGVASVQPSAHFSASDLMRRADELLYQAKKQGRNTVAADELTED